jgi:hypothetical protein
MREKLDVGAVLTRVLEYYRAQAGLVLPAALILFLPVAILNGVIRHSSGSILLSLLAAGIGLVATYWFQGMMVEAVRDIQDGQRDFDVASLFRSVMPVLAPLVGAGVLAGFGIAIGLVLLIVPGLILMTIWAVVAPVIVIERRGVFEAFRRSRELVQGNGLAVLGVIVLIFILRFVASVVLGAIAIGISDSVAGYAVAELLAYVLVAPLGALAAAVLYFELRRLAGEPPVHGGVLPAGVAPEPGPPVAPGTVAGTPPPPPGSVPPPPPPPSPAQPPPGPPSP